MRISPTPQPGEERLNRESREFLAYLRSVTPVPEERRSERLAVADPRPFASLSRKTVGAVGLVR